LKIELKENEGLVREITVELPAETVNELMEKGYTEYRQKVTLDGYRKGKVPMDVIKSNYGEQVRVEVAEDLIKTTYFDAIQEKSLKVASHPTVTGADYQEDGSFMYTAQVEVLPEINKINYDEMELKSEDIDVKDQEVDELIEHLRQKHAEFRKLDRAAAENDVVIADLEKTYDPKLVLKDNKFPDSFLDLSNPMTIKEFKEEIPGMKAGDEKEILVKYDKNYPDKHFADAEIRYLCRIKEIKEKILPEVNDGFAKTTGKAETALELRLKLREEINRHKEDEQKRNFKNQAIEQLCNKNQVPVPEAMVTHYLDHVIEDYKKSNQEFDEEAIRKNYRPLGETTMRWNLLMNRLAELENIEVSVEDTEKLIKRFAENYNTTPEKARELLNQSGRISEVKESLLEDKVLNFLIGKAKVVKEKKQKSE